MRRLRSWTVHLVLLSLGTLLSFAVLEASLRAYSAVFGTAPPPQLEPIIHDDRLGYRPNPAYPGHDRRGWRNASALAHADLVVQGDSQTYGVNAAPDEAWPQRLGVDLHRRVYQMAYGGYGPAHYLALLDEALALEPKVVLAMYYLGNDIYDAYWLVYRLGKYRRSSADPVLDALATSDPRVRAAITTVESRDPKDLRVAYLDCYSRPFQVADPDQLLRGRIDRPREDVEKETQKQAPAAPPEARRTLPQFAYRSVLFRTVWPRVRPRLSFVLGQIPASKETPVSTDYGPPLCVHYRDGAIRTVFNVGYRFVILDDSDPREIEGERINQLALKHLAERCRRAGIHFYVVLHPLKETVFRGRAEAALRNERLLVDLWHAEARVRRRAMAFFTREHISVIDTLPALESMIASGVNPYLENADGHPVARGYDAIARAVSTRLKKDHIWPR